jgi:hypothetical protein
VRKKKLTKKEIMEQCAGKKLDTPTEIRVFRIKYPDDTYKFIRQEGSEVIVENDRSLRQPKFRKSLLFFPANELVNVEVFRQALLDSHTTVVSGKKK